MTHQTADDPDALDKLRARLAASPADEGVKLRLAHALVRAQEHSSAQTLLGSLTASRDDSVWTQAVSLLAQIHELAGRQDEATVLWEQLLALDVDHPAARAHLARLHKTLVPNVPLARRADATLMSPEGVVASRYEILAELGRGGTSTVFLARDAHLDLHVALKVLHPFLGAATRVEFRQRFFREARMAAALRHPGVVAIYDLDESTRSLAMEYLPLGTLRHRLTQLGAQSEGAPLPVGEIESLTRGLLGILSHVHSAGLVHGDLKPRNILLRERGVPVLGDFGVARLMAIDPAAAGPAGTPLYFAPEQLRGAPSTINTDLFALGAMIWEMAAGRPMRTRADLTSGRFAAPALPPEAVAHLATARGQLLRVVQWTTVEDPERRPESAAQVLEVMG